MPSDPLTAALIASVLFAVGSVLLFGARATSPVAITAWEPDTQPAPIASLDWSLFRQAFAVRLLAALAIRFTGVSDFFAPDRRGYEAGGQALADLWGGQSIVSLDVVVGHYSGESNFYHYLNGASFWLGAGPWLIIAVNCLLGAMSPGLVSSIAARLGADSVGRRYAALLAAFFPSLVLWSAINIRDIWALTAILFALDSALAVRERLSPVRFAIFATSMIVLGGLRNYMFVLVAVGVGISVITSVSLNRARGFVAGVATAALCLYLYSTTGFGQQWVEEASLERLSELREGMTKGAQSAYLVEADISTPSGALQFLPMGLAYFWLAPFPWAIRGLRQAIAVPEMLLLYWLIPSAIQGARVAARRHFPQFSMVLCVVAVISVAYAFVEGNYGTAYRHRAQVIGPVLAITAIGLRSRYVASKPLTAEPASTSQ